MTATTVLFGLAALASGVSVYLAVANRRITVEIRASLSGRRETPAAPDENE